MDHVGEVPLHRVDPRDWGRLLHPHPPSHRSPYHLPEPLQAVPNPPPIRRVHHPGHVLLHHPDLRPLQLILLLPHREPQAIEVPVLCSCQMRPLQKMSAEWRPFDYDLLLFMSVSTHQPKRWFPDLLLQRSGLDPLRCSGLDPLQRSGSGGNSAKLHILWRTVDMLSVIDVSHTRSEMPSFFDSPHKPAW